MAAETKPAEAAEFRLNVGECARLLGTHVDAEDPAASSGLSPAEAAARLSRDGPNELPKPYQHPEIVKFLLQLLDPFLLMLTAAGILSIVPYAFDPDADATNGWLAGILFAVVRGRNAELTAPLGLHLDLVEGQVLVNATISYAQERSTSKLMEKLAKMLPSDVTVVRGGRRSNVAAIDLVVVCYARSGDRADRNR